MQNYCYISVSGIKCDFNNLDYKAKTMDLAFKA